MSDSYRGWAYRHAGSVQRCIHQLERLKPFADAEHRRLLEYLTEELNRWDRWADMQYLREKREAKR